jgi:hypothetical protein
LNWSFLSFLSEDVRAAMDARAYSGEFVLVPADGPYRKKASDVPESESAARARLWIAEAAFERKERHYVPITASWALSGQNLGCRRFVARLTSN